MLLDTFARADELLQNLIILLLLRRSQIRQLTERINPGKALDMISSVRSSSCFCFTAHDSSNLVRLSTWSSHNLKTLLRTSRRYRQPTTTTLFFATAADEKSSMQASAGIQCTATKFASAGTIANLVPKSHSSHVLRHARQTIF